MALLDAAALSSAGSSLGSVKVSSACNAARPGPLNQCSALGTRISRPLASPHVSRTSRRKLNCVAATGGGVSSKSRVEQWESIRQVLMKQVPSVSAEEAAKLVREKGHKILDVRPVAEFAEVHPEGAVNAQIYRLIQNWTPWDIARRAGFAFFGVFNGTEDNPEFLAEVEKVAKKDDPIIVACMMGGTVKPSTNFPQGKESRSLNAAHALVAAGYTNVKHMEGGLATYFREDHPVVFKDDN